MRGGDTLEELRTRAKTMKTLAGRLWELSHIRNLSRFVLRFFMRSLGDIRETFHQIGSATEEFSQTVRTLSESTFSVKEEEMERARERAPGRGGQGPRW
ncbi:MAG: hypothetical protein Q9N34_07890 [Aquificota bacterium]|nr:hypothetical protein [Aquificota bacterium]